jgi:TolB protein
VKRGSKLRVVGAAGFVLAAVFGAGAQPSGAAFAGRNGRIAFSSGVQLFSVTPSGKGLRALTPKGPDYRAGPAYSPSGKVIVYARSKCKSFKDQCGLPDLWTMAANGGHPHQLTNTPDIVELNPSWSPDGKHIVFSEGTVQGGTDKDLGLWVMNADGSQLRQLTPEGIVPSWSPDGKTIAYDVVDANAFGNGVDRINIYAIPAAGGEPTNLTPGAKYASDPDWSPSGRRIAFDLSTGLAVMKADGSNQHRIPHAAGGAVDAGPVWSPDGRWIAYTHGTYRRGKGEIDALYLIHPDGKGRHRVLRNAGAGTWQRR